MKAPKELRAFASRLRAMAGAWDSEARASGSSDARRRHAVGAACGLHEAAQAAEEYARALESKR